MNLTASLIVRDELSRYLAPCLDALLDFCDHVAILDDGSTDGTTEYLTAVYTPKIKLMVNKTPVFPDNEGVARQQLLDHTMTMDPTHILAIDADEFVEEGLLLRKMVLQSPGTPIWTLCMEEVWKADEDGLQIRFDGGWKPRAVPILYAVPTKRDQSWRISPRKLASGREPMAIRTLTQRKQAQHTGVSVLHFGWTNVSERHARFQRYAVADGGKYHQNAHLESIVWPDERVDLRGCEWAEAMRPVKAEILLKVNEQRPAPV